jgi:Na+/alanine symporter
MCLLYFLLVSFCLTFVFSMKFLEFNSLKDALETSWVKNQKPKSLERISKVFFIFQGNTKHNTVCVYSHHSRNLTSSLV